MFLRAGFRVAGLFATAVAIGLAPGARAQEITEQQRIDAAKSTARSPINMCRRAVPFYWEVGDASGRKVGGTVGNAGWSQSTPMTWASASKWLYGAYVAEVRQGAVHARDLELLRHFGGYTSLGRCAQRHTVEQCLNYGGNDTFTAEHAGKFYYNGGNFQKHAVEMGLGALDRVALAAEMQRVLGTDIALKYDRTTLAGGAVGAPASYAAFLRKLLRGDLKLGSQLGQHKVCTNPLTCPDALYSPIPPELSWNYGLGYWVEDDPVSGDGAFSAAGSLGFYPWIDSSRTYYGIVGQVWFIGAVSSVDCGRLIRKAWMTGVPQYTAL